MGCGPSVDKKSNKKKKNDRLSTQLKYTCLIFGMPDCDQSQAQDLLSKTFMSSAFSQLSYSFVSKGTSRSDRIQWPAAYKEYEKILLTFFFADVSTPGSVLLSIKCLNWFRSQINGNSEPIVVVRARTQREQPNIQTLQEKFPVGIELIILNGNNPQEMHKIVQRVNQAIQKNQEQVDGV
jgi:hypothetical protein